MRNERKFVRFLVVDRSARLWITAWEPEAEVLLGRKSGRAMQQGTGY